jgi:hypothetical protein
MEEEESHEEARVLEYQPGRVGAEHPTLDGSVAEAQRQLPVVLAQDRAAGPGGWSHRHRSRLPVGPDLCNPAGRVGHVQRSQRVTYLDDIRVLLTLLVILHHIAASYGGPGVWYYGEPVSGPGSAVFFTFLMAINQAFFMGFFFLLAGYFTPPALRAKGLAAFLRDRFLRLGIPLVVFVLTINPLARWLGGGVAWEFGTGPMWFVEILLLFTLSYVLVRPFTPVFGPIRVDRVSTVALALGMGLVSFLIRIRHPVNEWWTFPTIQPAHATQYVCLFAVGIWASGSDLVNPLSPGLTRFWRRAILLACVSALAAFMSTDKPGDGETNLAPLIGGGTWQSA